MRIASVAVRLLVIVAITGPLTPGAWIAVVDALPPDAPHPDDMVFDDVVFAPPTPERWELPNGLVVHVLADQALPLVNLVAYVRAGAIHERQDRAGLAQLTGEVMRSGGTGRRPPEIFDAALEDLASTIEVTVGAEQTIISASMLGRHVERTLDLVFDLLRNPVFDADMFESARGRAIESLRRQNDNPRGVVEREHRALLYGRHPYGRTPTPETLAAIERGDLVSFHRRFFHPNNVVLAVGGAVAPAELRALLDRTSGDWERHPVDLPPVPGVPPVASGGVPSVHHIEMDLSQSAIRVGHLGIDRHDPDRDAVALIDYVLGGGGFVSRLVQRLRVQEGIAYSVRSVFTLPRDTGMFYVETQTRSDQTVRAVGLITDEIRRMHDAGVTVDELADARSALINSDIFRYVTPAQVVAQVAALEFDGFAPDEFERRIEAYRTLRIEDVDAAARRVLRPDSLVVLVVGKAADFDTTLSSIGPVHEIQLSTPR